MRVIQVGMGGFGASWAEEVIPLVDGVELVGCVDPNQSALDGAQGYTGLPEERMFVHLQDALEKSDADAVLITATLPAHVPVALEALSAGKHVLVEKPFAPSVAEAEAVVKAAAEVGRVLMVSQNYRFFPAVQAVRRLVSSGEYGRLDSMYVDFRRWDNDAPAGYKHYVVPQPLLVDMAIHHFDLMRALLDDDPSDVHFHAWNPAWSNYVDPAAAVGTIQFSQGTVVSYRGNWVSPGEQTPWAGSWRMELEGANITWTSRSGAEQPEIADHVVVRAHGHPDTPLELPHMPYTDRAGSLNAFVEAVRSGREPETSGRQNVMTLALTYAAVESSETDAPVKLFSVAGA